MTRDTPGPGAAPPHPRTDLAVITAGLGIVLMIFVGLIALPFVRFLVDAIYGLFILTVLRPFGLSPPSAVTFVLSNVTTLAAALAAGRRIGALLAFRAVEGQLGSARLLTAVAWLSGAAGALGFAAAVPWGVEPFATQPSTSQSVSVAVAYLLHAAVLLIGPPRGVRRYLFAHPHCPRCWRWMVRETGGGLFALTDVPRVSAALAAGDFTSLRDLPLADHFLPGAVCSLHWWLCPECRAQAVLTCVAGEPTAGGAPVISAQLAGPSVDALRDLLAHRRALAHPGPPAPEPSYKARSTNG